MKTPTLCIYHGKCPDGFAAAWVVWKKFPNCIFHPGVYGELPPACSGHDVLMVDFSYKLDVMETIISHAKSVTVIDHHKTAQADLQQLLNEGKILGTFDMDHSGATLTWNWFNPDTPAPKQLQHIEDRDLWRFRLGGTREIHAALMSYPMTFESWDELLTCELDELRVEGEAIQRKHDLDVAEQCHLCKRRMQIGGHWVWAANVPHFMASDVGHTLCKTPIQLPGEQPAVNDPLPAFSATYFDRGDGKRAFSLRSIGDFDVSEIAKQYGGGGHKNAAGFAVNFIYDEA